MDQRESAPRRGGLSLLRFVPGSIANRPESAISRDGKARNVKASDQRPTEPSKHRQFLYLPEPEICEVETPIST